MPYVLAESLWVNGMKNPLGSFLTLGSAMLSFPRRCDLSSAQGFPNPSHLEINWGIAWWTVSHGNLASIDAGESA